MAPAICQPVLADCAVWDALGALPGVELLHDAASTQVTFAVKDEARTRAVVDHILADGSTWISGSRWKGGVVVRVSVSNWSTDGDDIAKAVEWSVKPSSTPRTPLVETGG